LIEVPVGGGSELLGLLVVQHHTAEVLQATYPLEEQVPVIAAGVVPEAAVAFACRILAADVIGLVESLLVAGETAGFGETSVLVGEGVFGVEGVGFVVVVRVEDVFVAYCFVGDGGGFAGIWIGPEMREVGIELLEPVVLYSGVVLLGISADIGFHM
jgi:hypothetical protein